MDIRLEDAFRVSEMLSARYSEKLYPYTELKTIPRDMTIIENIFKEFKIGSRALLNEETQELQFDMPESMLVRIIESLVQMKQKVMTDSDFIDVNSIDEFVKTVDYLAVVEVMMNDGLCYFVRPIRSYYAFERHGQSIEFESRHVGVSVCGYWKINKDIPINVPKKLRRYYSKRLIDDKMFADMLLRYSINSAVFTEYRMHIPEERFDWMIGKLADVCNIRIVTVNGSGRRTVTTCSNKKDLIERADYLVLGAVEDVITSQYIEYALIGFKTSTKLEKIDVKEMQVFEDLYQIRVVGLWKLNPSESDELTHPMRCHDLKSIFNIPDMTPYHSIHSDVSIGFIPDANIPMDIMLKLGDPLSVYDLIRISHFDYGHITDDEDHTCLLYKGINSPLSARALMVIKCVGEKHHRLIWVPYPMSGASITEEEIKIIIDTLKVQYIHGYYPLYKEI